MMAAWFIWLTQCSICLCVLYGFYKCLCGASTLFGFNRKVMLWGLAVCLCLPLGRWTTEREMPVQRPLQEWSEMLAEAWPETVVAVEAQPEAVEVRRAEGTGVRLLAFLPVVYAVGAGAVCLFYGVCYVRLWRLVRRGSRVRRDGWTEILTDEPVGAFSVGRYVVMNCREYQAYPLIRLHEQMHVRCGHTWDEVLMQVLTVLFWFHPLAWLLRKELREQHEFQADERVLQQGIDAKTYQILLVRKSVGAKAWAMASGFRHCSLKKRVTMMLRKRTNQWRRLGLLMALPLAGGTAWLFARPEMNVPQLQEVVAAMEMPDVVQADTVSMERRYMKVDDGLNVYDVYLDHRGQVFVESLGNNGGSKRETLNQGDLSDVLSASWVENYARLQRSFKRGKKFTVDVLAWLKYEKTEALYLRDIQVVEKLIREAVQKAVAELSHSHSTDEVKKVLNLNMLYSMKQ